MKQRNEPRNIGNEEEQTVSVGKLFHTEIEFGTNEN